ncbi:MAG: membrane protease YdiL (CAAX protease family) [Haloarculaceae archaeon]|jgi:membrane protease YdiL (CAAX protease family)
MSDRSAAVTSTVTAIGLTFGSYVAGAIVIVLTGMLLGQVGISLAERPGLRLLASTVLLQGVTFGGIALVYLTVRDTEPGFVSVSVPDLRGTITTFVGILVLIALLVTTSWVLSTFGLEAAQNQVVEIGQQNPKVFLLLVPLSFLLVGPGEELLFRGLVQGTLRESLSPVRAIVLASALFASIHLFSLSGEGKLVYIGLVFVLALVLGGIYEYTGNLTVPALVHGAYNAVQFAVAYLNATGGI